MCQSPAIHKRKVQKQFGIYIRKKVSSNNLKLGILILNFILFKKNVEIKETSQFVTQIDNFQKHRFTEKQFHFQSILLNMDNCPKNYCELVTNNIVFLCFYCSGCDVLYDMCAKYISLTSLDFY